MEMKKGQVFVMSAIIFSSIVLIAITSTQQSYTRTSEADVETYFQSILQHQPEAVNKGLVENYSSESVKKEMYTFNRFVERRSQSKSLSYESLQLVVIPDKERALVLNYRPRMIEYAIKGSSWNNGTLNPYQNEVLQVDSPEYRFKTEDLDIDRSFNASTPTLLGHVQLESQDSVLTDTVLR